MELVFFSWRRTAMMLALRVKLEEETDGKRGEKKKFLGLTSTKLLMEGTLVDDQISILWLRSGPRTKERKLVGRGAESGGTKESDVVRITL